MKKQFAISFVVAGMAIALAALFGMRVADVEAATPALMLDPETSMPVGSLVFHVEDHTCIVLPTHQMECFCSCSSGTCNTQVEIVPLLPTPVVTNAVPVTPTTSNIHNNLVPVPRSEETPTPEPESRGESGRDRPKGNNGVGNGEDPQPPGNPPINDGPGTSPGNPGNRGGGNGRGNKKD